MKNLLAILTLSLFYTFSSAQRMLDLNETYFTTSGTKYEPAYNYNFEEPIPANVLSASSATYTPEMDNRYFMSIFGPRHKHSDYSNIGYYDYHKGADITKDVKIGTVQHDSLNSPMILCMCEGVVFNVVDGTDEDMEETGTGRYVEVKCNEQFATPGWGNVYIASRHLRSIAVDSGDVVMIGDTLGQMGNSGHTETVHLHLSVIRRDANGSNSTNVHPMRIFDPNAYEHLLDQLTYAEFTQLNYAGDSALFRLAIPYNMANLRTIKVMVGTELREYDIEAISQLPEEDRDDNDAVTGLEFFAYPFNRGRDAYRRFWNRHDEGMLNATYPASPDRGAGSYYPFLSENLTGTPAYVLDLKVKDIPVGLDVEDIEIEVIDIYGYGVRAEGQLDNYGGFAYARIDDGNKDALQDDDGEVSLDDDELEFEEDEFVALRFTDLQIPKDAQIERAIIHFRAGDSEDHAFTLEIAAEQNATPAPFDNTEDYDISDRLLNATSEISWALSPWVDDEMQANQMTPDLKALVQELVNLPNWTTSSPMVFIFEGTNGAEDREAYSFEGSERARSIPYIYIEYVDVASMPADPPTITLNNPTTGGSYQFQTLYLGATASDLNDDLDRVEFYVDNNLVGTAYNFFNGNFWTAWVPTFIGNHTCYAIAYDESGLSTQTPTVSFSVFHKVILYEKISSGSNDVEQWSFGNMKMSDPTLDIVKDNSFPFFSINQYIGLRYEGVNIPQGAMIIKAHVQFTTSEAQSGSTNLFVHAHDTDDAAPFLPMSGNVSNRVRTSNFAYWNAAPWLFPGQAGPQQRTPELKTVIQEVVDRNGWQSGNDLAIIIRGSGLRMAKSYEGSSFQAPRLYVEYLMPTSLVESEKEEQNEKEMETRTESFELPILDTPLPQEFGVKIYPNPVIGQTVNIEINAPSFEGNSTVQLVDINGHLVANRFQQMSEQAVISLDLSALAAGTYLVVVQAGINRKVEQVILAK